MGFFSKFTDLWQRPQGSPGAVPAAEALPQTGPMPSMGGGGARPLTPEESQQYLMSRQGEMGQTIGPPQQPQGMSPMGAPASTARAALGGLSSPAGMMGGMFGDGGSSPGGTLNNLWQASKGGVTVPNQPYQPFSGKAPQPQGVSRFGMPQQNSGSGSGYRRMRAPTGEERDIHESQAQHFLSRGGKWA